MDVRLDFLELFGVVELLLGVYLVDRFEIGIVILFAAVTIRGFFFGAQQLGTFF